MVVFLSSRKVMVLGVPGSCCKFCFSLPTVRVKEFFPTEAIFPDTDCCRVSVAEGLPRLYRSVDSLISYAEYWAYGESLQP